VDRTRRYDVLDGMRGVAALSVMLYHFSATSDGPLLKSAPLAVDLFFALSGFVLVHSYGERLRGGMPYAGYLLRRLVRLYPMFVVGIVLGVILLLAGAPQPAGLDRGTIIAGGIYNAAFIPYIRIGPGGDELFPANPPAWSLFFEMAASAGAGLLFAARRRRLAAIIVGAAVALIACALLSFDDGSAFFQLDLNQGWGVHNFLGGFPRTCLGFAFGILVYRVARADNECSTLRGVCRRYFCNSYVVYTALLLIFLVPRPAKGLFPLLAIMALSPALVFAGALLDCRGRFEQRLARALGWLSYPVYCLHVPVFRAVAAATGDADHAGWLTIGLAAAATLAVSAVVTTFYEAPVRGYLARQLF
jgi:peptidoglycan/LPS O-acetylase OafA/YrhL